LFFPRRESDEAVEARRHVNRYAGFSVWHHAAFFGNQANDYLLTFG
jgi:hypothetical protein